MIQTGLCEIAVRGHHVTDLEQRVREPVLERPLAVCVIRNGVEELSAAGLIDVAEKSGGGRSISGARAQSLPESPWLSDWRLSTPDGSSRSSATYAWAFTAGRQKNEVFGSFQISQAWICG